MQIQGGIKYFKEAMQFRVIQSFQQIEINYLGSKYYDTFNGERFPRLNFRVFTVWTRGTKNGGPLFA